MEQLINTMLANAQIPQIPGTVKKGESSGQKDGFQKLLEQKQTDSSQAPRQEKAETPQKPQDAQKGQEAQESQEDQENPTVQEDGKVLEERMTLAAMLMAQAPVVPVEETLTPEVQTEAAAEVIAPLAAETVLTPEEETLAPEAETKLLETPVESGENQAASQTMTEELPQTIQAPEATQDTEGRTVEVKVETGSGEEAASDAGEDTAPQGAEVETPVFEDVKAVPVKVGETHKAPQPEEIMDKQVAPRIDEALANGQTRVELQLTPENLGKITIQLTTGEDGKLLVVLHAENRDTQSLLSRDTTRLAELLGRETQQEVRVEVPRQEESQRQDLYEQQQEQRQHRQQQEQRRKRESAPEDFLQQLRLGLIPMDGE